MPDAEMLSTGVLVADVILLALDVTVEQAEAYARVAAAEAEHVHALGPVLDPTGYRIDSSAADAARRVSVAFLEFRRVVEASRG